MVCGTPSSQDASTHQIWNSYLKEYRRYAPDTKRDGRTDGRCDYYMPPKVPLGGIKNSGSPKDKKNQMSSEIELYERTKVYYCFNSKGDNFNANQL